mmetsp:Transcript_6236/g.9100  ORF Transcript_6236/g.9100 Transcript_6236/m.9100 type:complete len:405 (-) Transcript_6236:1056-2270(-)
MSNLHLLSPEQISTYLHDGILVVDDLLSSSEIVKAQTSLAKTLLNDLNVDISNLEETGHNLTKASSTNGAGGVLDIFYPEWKMNIATNEQLFRMTRQLWKEAYFNGETEEDVRWHPYGAFDCNRGYMYIDRIGFRLPSKLADSIGERQRSNNNSEAAPNATTINSDTLSKRQKKKKKSRAIQRSLTPHFDLCPETYQDATNKNKWRPIQCFVSLTDNLLPNTGGFECCPGFHREFHSWVQRGRRLRSNNDDDGEIAVENIDMASPPKQQPCVGEYTHVHDRELMKRVQHIPVKAGSVVFWDNRLPHGNSYRNDNNYDPTISSSTSPLESCGARAVVYCSFLPDVAINRGFVERQLIDWKLGRAPRVGDRWIKQDDDDDVDDLRGNEMELKLSDLGRKLIGLEKW